MQNDKICNRTKIGLDHLTTLWKFILQWQTAQKETEKVKIFDENNDNNKNEVNYLHCNAFVDQAFLVPYLTIFALGWAGLFPTLCAL